MSSTRLDGSDWHFHPDEPLALGCAGCFLREICGGLHVKGGAIDCQRFCCGGKPDCKVVCFNSKRNYAKRLKEIRGFDLHNVPRCGPVEFSRLRGFAPLIHHAYVRKKEFHSETIALSLYALLDREGAPRYVSREEIAKNFRISSKAKLLVSGIHWDRLLERVWRSPHRNSIAVMLKAIGVAMFTPPNFSVYNNVPRPENLYNIKRIALLSQEFLAAGVPTALHINACTDLDYDRYLEFLFERPEFQAISFDFITGPGNPSRIWWHIKKLIELRNRLRRQIQLVLRGGTPALAALAGAYSDIVIIDSKPLHTALRRHRMVFGNDGKIKVVENHLPIGTPVDDLLSQNVVAARSHIDYLLRHPRIANSLRGGSRPRLNVTNNAHDKSRQLDLLANSAGVKSGTGPVNAESVIPAAKSESPLKIHEAAKELAEPAAVSRKPAES
jgi:hypothetical protein